MLDTKEFIECVKNNPSIWNNNSAGYGDRLLRENCWKLIGQQMFESWDEKTEEERHHEVLNMKNKWRHMRDSFNKYINQGNSRFGGMKKRRYIYADYLSFLLQRSNRQPRAVQEEDTVSNITIHQQSTDRARHRIQLPARKINFRTTEKTNPINRSIIKNNTNPSVSHSEDDPDRCYLLSLLPEFKRLGDDEKLDFRFHTLQFFRVIRSKRMTRMPKPVNGWEEDMDCDMDETYGNQHVSAPSTSHSPRASLHSSCPNSPTESNRSNESTSSRNIDIVKSELT